MYKVLLVDDEIFVRKGIINLIDWASHQYEICGEAENGQHALTMIEELKPDLVIADIRMPVLDGLGLIKEVKENGTHQPLFIIVSGYHDFSYAQQALRYDVFDYILKPVDENELEATLRKVAGELSKRRLTTLTGEKSIDISVMETLMTIDCSESDAEQFAQALNIAARGRYQYVILQCYSALNLSTEEQQVQLNQIEQSLKTLLSSMSYPIPIHTSGAYQFGLFVQVDKLIEAFHTSTPHEAFRILHDMFVKHVHPLVTLFVGTEVKHLMGIAESAKIAQEGLQYRFAEDGKSVIFVSEIMDTPLYYFDIDVSLYNKLLLQIEEHQIEVCYESVQAIFQQFKDKRFAPSAVANAITRCTIGIINIVRNMDGTEQELTHLQQLLDWQKSTFRLTEIQHIFAEFVQEASHYIHQQRGTQGKGSIEKIKKYIDAHYVENINLKSIASTFYMNSVYLGQLFRKTYGVYFNDYLLSLRIEEAKKLLRQSDLRMYEIAEKVGFQNADYFVTQFEKLEKLTPTDYRNKLLGKTK